jgi:hypothetical protein
MKNLTFNLPTDALALGFVHPDTLANRDDVPVLELLRHALDADGAMSDDPALGLLLGLRRDVFILGAAVGGLDDEEMRMALHSAWLKLGAAVNLHTRQIDTLRAALAQAGAREVA